MHINILGSINICTAGATQPIAIIHHLGGNWAQVQIVELVSVSPDAPAHHETPGLPPVALLTPRERDVLFCLARGDDNREIAEELRIAVRTVNRHLENIRRKVGYRRRSDLVRIARGSGPADPAWPNEHPIR